MVLKAALLAWSAFPFNADEAVVALMARHILAGARPTFFYGQAYMGSLDAALVALGFALVGQQVIVIRVIQALLYFGTVTTTVLLGARLFGSRRAGVVAGLLMAIPTVNVTLYTTVSLGGYGETLLIGNLLLLLGLRIYGRPDSVWPYAVWGLLAGLGFWGFALVLVYAIPSAGLVLWSSIRQPRRVPALGRVGVLVLSTLVGALPWIAWAASQGVSALLAEMAGSAIAGASPPNPLAAVGAHVANLLLLGSTVIWGLRPPWEVRWLALPLLPLALAFWLVVATEGILSLRRPVTGKAGRWLLAVVSAVLVAAFVLSPFGADPSGRYFLPLAAPLALAAGDLIDRLRPRAGPLWTFALLTGILTFNLLGTLQCALRNPPGLTTQFDSVTWIDHRYDQELIAFLRRNGERRGYSNYWVAYPTAFLSGEEVILVPRLPYHQDFRYTPRDDRYPPYDARVAESTELVYVTTNHPALDDRLREGFRAAGAAFREAWIGNYHVFYNLSREVRPEDLDLASQESPP